MDAPGSTNLCFYYLSLNLGEILVLPISHFDLASESHFPKGLGFIEHRRQRAAGKIWFCSCRALLESQGRERRKYKQPKQLMSRNIFFSRDSHIKISSSPCGECAGGEELRGGEAPAVFTGNPRKRFYCGRGQLLETRHCFLNLHLRC